MAGERTCLVVGGCGGIGRATTARLRQNGWRCVVSSSRAREPGADLQIDLTEPDTFSAVAQDLPPLDGLVVAAGMAPVRPLSDTCAPHVQRMLAVHVSGPLLLVAALRPLVQTGGAIVLFSSIAATAGSYDPAYASAKGGVAALGRTLARELAPSIRVNVVAAGVISGTPVYESMSEDFRQRHVERALLKRVGTLEECASAVEFLLSHPHLTGAVLPLDGGRLP